MSTSVYTIEKDVEGTLSQSFDLNLDFRSIDEGYLPQTAPTIENSSQSASLELRHELSVSSQPLAHEIHGVPSNEALFHDLCYPCAKLDLVGMLEGISPNGGSLVKSQDILVWARQTVVLHDSTRNHYCPSCRAINTIVNGISTESVKDSVVIDFGESNIFTFRSCDRIYKPKLWGLKKKIEAEVESSRPHRRRDRKSKPRMWGPKKKIEAESESSRRQQFAIYLYGVRSGRSSEKPFETFGILSSSYNTSYPLPALCGRKVLHRQPSYELLKAWIGHCVSHHPETCTSTTTEELQFIKLIDVDQRRVVEYSQTDACDYLALSYVWGNWSPDAVSVIGALPATLPATIEDAIEVTKQLGKRYLWVDSICINQNDQSQKMSQIGMMDLIYGGAYATIINLSGDNADAGLPRVGRKFEPVLQKTEVIRGKTLVAIMPTLDEQLDKSEWASRAWTFQECTLSPRRLFFTPNQVYFACNRLQCCESVDDTILLEQDCLPNGNVPPVLIELSKTTMRNPFVKYHSLQKPTSSFALYERLVQQYTSKHMTHESDSLSALSGLLSRLETDLFPRGFSFGLPINELRAGLLWRHRKLRSSQLHIVRERRNDFPSWSWCGWKGRAEWSQDLHWAQKATTVSKPQPPLVVWKNSENNAANGIQEMYRSNPLPSATVGDLHSWTNVILEVAPLVDDVLPRLENNRIILIEAVFVKWIVNFRNNEDSIFITSPRNGKIHQGVKCNGDRFQAFEQLKIYNDEKPHDFLFLHISDSSGYTYHMSFLALEWQGDVAYRRALVELDTRKPDTLLTLSEPHVRRIKLG